MKKELITCGAKIAGHFIFLWILGLASFMLVSHSIFAQYGRTMTTVQYNPAHTGWNPDEVVLNINNVNPIDFGKKWTAQLDGQIYAAPLYVGGVKINGTARQAVYAATENNFIYALDAETGEALWPLPYFLGPPGLQSQILDDCGSIRPNIGITSTPVIDLETGTLYAVGLTWRDSEMIFKMAALDIATGESRVGWPMTIDPITIPRLDTRVTANRGALVLANGYVYVPFGGYGGDCGPYHGWVVGMDKANPNSPQIFYRTPGTDDHRGSGIWAAGGLAADADGHIYAVTGNSFKAPQLDYSNAVLRLNPDLSFSMAAEDFFMPSNWVDLNDTDDDLGSSAALLVPAQAGSTTPNLIFVGGKRGVGHLINRDNLGGVARGDGITGEGIYSERLFEHIMSTAAYYEDAEAGPIIYVAGLGRAQSCSTSNSVMALRLERNPDGSNLYRTLWCTPSMAFPTAPIITSAPDQAGILWVVDVVGTLYAFHTATGQLLFDSGVVPGDELSPLGNYVHFTAIDGKVFVGTWSGRLMAYGLREISLSRESSQVRSRESGILF